MLTRRSFARLGLIALPLTAASGRALAAGYPEKPIRMIVGFPAGQSSDASARRIAHKMSEILSQGVMVDNRPGAAGIISHEALKNAAADGYTLLMGSTGTLAINPSLYSKLPYNPLRDFDPVALVAASPLALFAPASSPVNNLKELVAYCKARPGKVTYGSAGSGTTGHIAMEMLKNQTGIFLLHIPYKGSPPMITDLIGGQLDFAFEPIGSVQPFARSGRVKILGLAAAKRYPATPDVPTLIEQGLTGFEAVPWTALMAPKGTPPAVMHQLNAAVNAALKDPAIVEEFAKLGSTPLGGSVDTARQYMQQEINRWGKAVKASGAKVD